MDLFTDLKFDYSRQAEAIRLLTQSSRAVYARLLLHRPRHCTVCLICAELGRLEFLRPEQRGGHYKRHQQNGESARCEPERVRALLDSALAQLVAAPVDDTAQPVDDDAARQEEDDAAQPVFDYVAQPVFDYVAQPVEGGVGDHNYDDAADAMPVGEAALARDKCTVLVEYEVGPFLIVEGSHADDADCTRHSYIVAAKPLGSIVELPEVPMLAKLDGELLLAAPDWMTLVVARVNDVPSFMELFDDNVDEHKLYMDVGECGQLVRTWTRNSDVALRLDALANALQGRVRCTETGSFHVENHDAPLFAFDTIIAQDLERAVRTALIEAVDALTEHDLLAFLVHPLTAPKAKSALGLTRPDLLLAGLWERFEPRVEKEEWTSREVEFDAWFNANDLMKLSYTFQRVVQMAKVTRLLGPSSDIMDKVKKAWHLHEDPGAFEAAVVDVVWELGDGVDMSESPSSLDAPTAKQLQEARLRAYFVDSGLAAQMIDARKIQHILNLFSYMLPLIEAREDISESDKYDLAYRIVGQFAISDDFIDATRSQSPSSDEE